MSKLKVTTISDPDNDNTAITVDTSGNVTFAQNATFSGTVSGIDSGAKTISDDDTATYSDGEYFVSSTGVAYRYLNDGTSSAWYEVGSKQVVFPIYPKDSIAKGGDTSFYINSSGELYGIGRNEYGQLGIGNTTDLTSWTLIDIDNVVKVFCYSQSTYLVKSDGTLWVTGRNNVGQLGLNDTNDRNTFIQSGISNVDDVAISSNSCLVLKSDGSVWATGANGFGHLGLGDTTNRSTFEQTVSSGAIGIMISNYNAYYINSSGAVYGIGYNYYGQIGDGTTTDRTSWTATNITSGASKIIKGNPFLYCHIIKTDGSLWAVGRGAEGQIGDGSTSQKNSFTQIISSGVSEVSSGFYSTAIIKTDGSVSVTGANTDGQLGLGDTTQRNSFTATSITSGAAACSLTNTGSFILKDDDTIVSAGNNTYYQLGDETNTSRTSFGSTTVTDAVGEYEGEVVKTVGELV